MTDPLLSPNTEEKVESEKVMIELSRVMIRDLVKERKF